MQDNSKLKTVKDLTDEDFKNLIYVYTGLHWMDQDYRNDCIKDIKEVEVGGYNYRRRFNFLKGYKDDVYYENYLEIESVSRDTSWTFSAKEKDYYEDNWRVMYPADIVELVYFCKVNDIDLENRLRSSQERIAQLDSRSRRLKIKTVLENE
jgi:hypothetical protein